MKLTGLSQSVSTTKMKVLSKINSTAHKCYIKCILESFNLKNLIFNWHFKHLTKTAIVNSLCTFVTGILCVKGIFYQASSKVLLHFYFEYDRQV